ncbi:Protein CBG10391 [Caenorhabditis briggsae]|uniref:Uncharacterized protein n=2 Tax=Caenorhabditis briggsae TaxID=6238 RepID=A0AAE9A4W7_CAEBR|nr:Protein CBG10391 [Caenorhabditis briggsae]ULT87109.1 hypothetical protein L3Y34_006701 [Caenorhabditis briggsae]CAP29816.1 Protein CBG10391 [Caenorhabditis briggsae]
MFFRSNASQKLLAVVLILSVIAFLTHIDHFVADLEKLETSPECQCISKRTGKSHNFCYPVPRNPGWYGRKFNCSFVETLENLNLLGDSGNVITLQGAISNKDALVFVSATSEDHFGICMWSYKSVRKYYPNHKYVLFGLNISESSIDKLPKSDPNFEFRGFDVTLYPEYVTNFKRNHFKGLVLAEAMRDYPVLLWIDAYIKMIEPNVIEDLFEEISENRMSKRYSELISFDVNGHNNYAVLHSGLLHYFPFHSFELLKNEHQLGSGIIFVPRTNYNRRIMKWWVLCSLTDECINPPGSKHYQPVLNILLLNDFQDYHKYYMKKLESSFIKMDWEKLMSIEGYSFGFYDMI